MKVEIEVTKQQMKVLSEHVLKFCPPNVGQSTKEVIEIVVDQITKHHNRRAMLATIKGLSDDQLRELLGEHNN